MPQGTERPSGDKGEQYEKHNAPECRKEMRTMNLSPAPVRRCPRYYVHKSSVTPMASMEPKPGCDVECNLVFEFENGSGNASTLEKPNTVQSLVSHVSLHSGDGRSSRLGDRNSGSDCAVVAV